MTALPALTVTDRYRLKELALQASSILPAGKVIWCQGRRILGYGTIERMARVMLIPKGTDTVCVAAADYDLIKEWIA